MGRSRKDWKELKKSDLIRLQANRKVRIEVLKEEIKELQGHIDNIDIVNSLDLKW